MAAPTLPTPPPSADPDAPGTTVVPGLAAVGAIVAACTVLAGLVPAASSLVVGVVVGAAWTNLFGVPASLRAGVAFSARVLLRIGIVLLGLRLSLGDVVALGGPGIVVVAGTVIATFFGTQWLGRRLGLGRDLSLLIATGYSICGASAIAAMAPATDADEDDVAAAIGLVTLFGTLAIVVLPVLGGGLGLDTDTFGAWVGASTHDVAQVLAAASTGGSVAVSAAIVVKLTRVVLLAPLVTGVSLRRRADAGTDDRPPLLPWFVAGFLGAVVVASTSLVPDIALDGARVAEQVLLTAAMVGLGTGVRVARLRALGFRPLVLGVAAWAVVAGISLAGVLVVT